VTKIFSAKKPWSHPGPCMMAINGKRPRPREQIFKMTDKLGLADEVIAPPKSPFRARPAGPRPADGEGASAEMRPETGSAVEQKKRGGKLMDVS